MTSIGDSGSLSHANRRRRRQWVPLAILFAVVPVIVVLLREAGLLQLNYYTTTISGNSSVATHEETIRNFIPLKSIEGLPQSVTVIADGPNGMDSHLAAVLERDLRAAKMLSMAHVHFKTWSGDGVAWLPLWKSVSVKYEADFDGSFSGDTVLVKSHGTASGTIDCKVTGICSYRDFRRILAGEVSESIVHSVNSTLARAKNTPTPSSEN